MPVEKVELLDKSHRQWDLLRSNTIMMSRNWWYFSSENEGRKGESWRTVSHRVRKFLVHLCEPSLERTTWALCVCLWDETRKVSVALRLGRGRAVMQPLSRVWGWGEGQIPC